MKHKRRIALGIALVALMVIAAALLAGCSALENFTNLTQLDEPAIVNTPLASGGEPASPAPTEEQPTGEPTPEEEMEQAPQSVDLDLLFAPFWESWELLHQHYVDLPLDDEALRDGAIDGLEAALDGDDAALEEVEVPDDAPSAEALSDEADTPLELEDLFLPFWEAWRKAQHAERGEFMTDRRLMQRALSGMVDSLGDPHTSYLTPEEYQQINIPLQGEYEGIGAWVDTSGDYVTVISPMPGSPAEEAGLEPGDEIIAVDGEDMTGVPGDLVIRRVLGPAGTDVILTIRREGVEEPFDVEITRAHIVIPSVESEMLENDVAYLQLFSFGDQSPDELREHLADLLDQNPRGLILDLRNNGGGFLHAAITITSEFIEGEKVLLYERYGDGSQDVHESMPGGLATDIPLVVLVNEGTASASEILAGAVRDYERGYLVGTTTFGKGTVQLPLVLQNDQGALRITIARWLTPAEKLIHGVGIEPDFVVELTQEDIEADRDPQLDKAIEVILTEYESSLLPDNVLMTTKPQSIVAPS